MLTSITTKYLSEMVKVLDIFQVSTWSLKFTINVLWHHLIVISKYRHHIYIYVCVILTIFNRSILHWKVHLSCFRLVWRKEVFIRKFFSIFPFLQRIRIYKKNFGNIRYLMIGLLDMTLHYFTNTNSNVFLCLCYVTIKWILMSLSDELQHKMSFL